MLRPFSGPLWPHPVRRRPRRRGAAVAVERSAGPGAVGRGRRAARGSLAALALWAGLLLGAAAAAAPPAGPPVRVVVAVLPFEVHSEKPLDYLEGSLAELLATRLEASGRVDVVEAVTVRETLIAWPGEKTEDALRRLARELSADWVVVGSLTELAGHYSLDVRVTPAGSRVTTSTRLLAAEGDDQLLDRVNELSSHILEIVEGRPPEPAAPPRAEAVEEAPAVAEAAEPELGSEPTAGQRIAEVRVRGNKRIETAAILARVTSKPGERLSRIRIAEDVRGIYALGFFRDVQVYEEDGLDGRILIFEVAENPVIRQVTITGNENVDGEKIKDNLTLTTGSTLDYPLLFENRQRIEALYRAEGYYLAKVGSQVETLPGDAVGVHFEVTEGEKLRLRRIDFVGTEAKTDKQLAEGLKTKTWHWYSIVTSFLDKSGTYSEPVFLQDLETVTNKYLDDGYVRADVGQPEVDAQEDGLVVKVPVTEGDQYH